VIKTRLTLAALLMGTAFLTVPSSYADTPATAAPTPSAQVDFYRGDLGHTGVSAEKLAAPLSLIWRHTTLAAPNNPASAVYAGGTVYFVSGGGVYALHASDGTTQWQYPADGKPVAVFAATPALDGGFLYVTDDSGQAYKLDAATGKEVWKVKLDGTLRSAPVVTGGMVYFGSSNGHCYALSAATGQTVWDETTNGPILTSPVVTGGLVVFSSSDSSVYSLNARTGHKAWSVPYDADPSLVPLVYDGRLLYVTAGDTIYCLDPESGRQRTTIKLPTNVLISPTAASDATYIITQSNTLYSLGAGGRQRWKTTVAGAPTAAPLLAGDLLVVTTQPGIVSGYDAGGGGLLWQYAMQSTATDSQPKLDVTNVFAAPIVADGTLYVVSDDGSLSAFRHDAPDDVAPEIAELAPASGTTVPTDGLTYGALIVDQGSGINPTTVSLEFDGKADPLALYHGDSGAIYRTLTTPLTEGDHQITVKASDWHGNVISQNWHFTVRDGATNRGGGRFNPFGGGYRGRGGRNPYAPPPPPSF
jgi:outer membrane protein assembly factor BamB